MGGMSSLGLGLGLSPGKGGGAIPTFLFTFDDVNGTEYLLTFDDPDGIEYLLIGAVQ